MATILIPMKKLLLLICIFCTTVNYAQEKKMWAKSYLHQKAPDFVVESWLTDKPDMEGKFVLIDFWATWCGPCKKAIPDLNTFQKKFKDQLVVIGITNETKEKVATMKKPVMHYYSATDSQARLFRAYEITGIPHCVIINPDGIVVWEGYPLLDDFELTEATIKSLLTP